MFDLTKDVDKYRGIPPYASELYGVYQPLLGWQSQLTKKWIQHGGELVDPGIKSILDAHITPAPMSSFNPDLLLMQSLEPGTQRRPFTVLLTKGLGSQLLRILRDRVQTYVEDHAGQLPDGPGWQSIVDRNDLRDENAGSLRKANDYHAARLKTEIARRSPKGQLPEGFEQQLEPALREAMRYESQIAKFLLLHAEAHDGYDPNQLQKLFHVIEAPPLADILRPADPLASIDPKDRSGALSPVAFVHLFRQYFFNLGTFLGEPVEHVWLAPGTTIELVEVSTRKVLIERMLEQTTESTMRAERGTTLSDEISDSTREENESSTKLGVSQTNKVNVYVYEGTASANVAVESTRSKAREVAYKQNREQTERLATELKQSFRSVFRTVTETTDTTSRRHVIENRSRELVNYELRRKMRRVGVQIQDLGSRLCWQMFVDHPGRTLGLAELVHFVESPELAGLKEPEKIEAPGRIVKQMLVPIPFLPILDYKNNHAHYEWEYVDPPGTRYEGKHLSRIRAADERSSQTIMGPFHYAMEPPETGYELEDVRLLGVQEKKIGELREKRIVDRARGKFELVMQRVNFGGENMLNLEMELLFAPTATELTRISDANKSAQTRYDAERERLLRQSFMESVRARIKDASNIQPRRQWDLREEERTVIYRALIRRLMMDSWNLPDTGDNQRLSHVRSELIRSLFDVDSMLYFVAPEWWMPRRHEARLDLDMTVEGKPFTLSENDAVKWGDGGTTGRPNYRLTEDSTPVRLGSSLGWLLQLDGDNLRNAFLNAPWAKAIVPIRPGREKAALNWLRSIEGHQKDGWDTTYVGTEPELAGKKLGEVLELVAGRLEQENGDIKNVLEADEVFERGFAHLAGGFNAALDANQVFSQWISVVPTDQIVAVKYEPTDLLKE